MITGMELPRRHRQIRTLRTLHLGWWSTGPSFQPLSGSTSAVTVPVAASARGAGPPAVPCAHSESPSPEGRPRRYSMLLLIKGQRQLPLAAGTPVTAP
jgi:hypothetical protein